MEFLEGWSIIDRSEAEGKANGLLWRLQKFGTFLIETHADILLFLWEQSIL